jgi:hypothetical protein
VMSDTPYRFDQVGEFSCAVGRGAPDNSLLLVNHWLTVDPPNPAVAAKVNAGDVLRERAAACREERGRLPNIIAVDFYASGDLFEVVDELNGVASAADAD